MPTRRRWGHTSGGHIIVPSAEFRLMMARTIATKKQTCSTGTAMYPDCEFTQQDDYGRTLTWKMGRVDRNTGKANGWRFFVPTIPGYRLDAIKLNRNEYIPYLLATDEELGTRTVVETLYALHKAQPQRTLRNALPVVATPQVVVAAQPAAADDDTLAEILPEANGVLAEGADAGALHALAVRADEDLDTPDGLYAAVRNEL